MHWESIVHKHTTAWAVRPPAIAKGIDQFLAALPPKKAAPWRAALRKVPWDRDITPLAKWVDRVIAKFPLEDDIAGLWFYVPEIELNDPFTYFVGSRSFHTKDGQWACSDDWNLSKLAEKAGLKRLPLEFVPTVLRDVQRACNIGPGDIQDLDRPQAPDDIYSGVTLAYCGLLVRHALDKVNRKRLLGGRDFRGVGFGYQSGDTEDLGVVTHEGWEAPTRKHIVERPADSARRKPENPKPANPKFDMNSDDFNLRAYIKAGLDLHARDADGNTTLMKACGATGFQGPNYGLARDLIKAGVDVKTPGGSRATPLLLASTGPADVVRMLLERGASPNAKNSMDHAPIHSAVGFQRRLDNIRLMLEHDGDPNLPGLGGRRPLHYLADDGDPTYVRQAPSPHVVALLIERGAKIDTADGDGNSPLQFAVGRYAAHATSETPGERSQFARVILALLKHGADPNRRYKVSPDPRIPAGGTPLMCQRYDDGEIHLALLEHGADPKLKCGKGKSALEYARKALARAKPKQRPGIQRVIDAIEAAIAASNGKR